MWEKVGVDLTLDPRETGSFNTIFRNRSYDQMIYGVDGSVGVYPRLQNINNPSQENSSYINDSHINDVGKQMAEYLITNQQDKMAALHKDLMKYVLEQAWVVPSVLSQRSAFWWPWLKDYHGEQSPGNNNMWMWAKYVWVDQDLKTSTLGK